MLGLNRLERVPMPPVDCEAESCGCLHRIALFDAQIAAVDKNRYALTRIVFCDAPEPDVGRHNDLRVYTTGCKQIDVLTKDRFRSMMPTTAVSVFFPAPASARSGTMWSSTTSSREKGRLSSNSKGRAFSTRLRSPKGNVTVRWLN
jgi:hypothetical protein